MTTTRAAVCTGLNEPWKTEEIEIDPPGNREVRVKMVWSGMCHSDEHLRTGDISQTPEVLEMMGVKSMFPVVGGHEGSGIVTEVGTNVTQVAEGDHVAVSFIPSCGTCHWCASGRQNLCDLGMMTLAGGMISDGTYRYHLGGEDLNRMAQLGTFADEMVVHENSLVRINPWDNMKAAALDQLRHRHRFRLGRRPGQGQARRDGRGGRVRRRRLRSHSGRPHRRGTHDHRGRPRALQAREGQGVRRDAHGAVAARRPDDAPRADHGPQRRRGHPDAGRAEGRAHRAACCAAAPRTPASW